GDLTSTISVIVVAGACGIAAGTPLAVLAAIARAARSGAFIKGGAHLEALSTVDTVVFDKTGTLTSGAPAVVDIWIDADSTREELLSAAATAEYYSEHPLGRAILAHAADVSIDVGPPDSFDYAPGQGVTAHVAGSVVTAGTSALVPG